MTYVARANSWIIIIVGGGPTADKPTVTLGEIRCYTRNPDGHLITVGQTTLARGSRPPSRSPV